MKRLLIEIGDAGVFSEQPEFKFRIETDKINEKMMKSIIKSLEDVLEQIVLYNKS